MYISVFVLHYYATPNSYYLLQFKYKIKNKLFKYKCFKSFKNEP